ncbi:MAG: hypothetical protein KY394_02705, partial [Actinobacteria bacterium]|nr:hypothetical protein [Actinomycetota bacterium]
HDAKASLELVAQLAADGVDLRRFVAECVAYFRGVFLAHYAPNLAEIVDEPAEVYQAWSKTAEMIPAGEVLRAVDLLGEALLRLREGREERLMTELAMIKLTRPETASDPEALIARMDRLERRMGKPGDPPALGDVGGAAPKQPAAKEPPEPSADIDEKLAQAAAPLIAEEEGEAADAPERPAKDISFDELQKIWPGLFGGLRDVLGARRWAFFRETIPGDVSGNTIILEVAHDFHLAALEEDDAVSRIVATKAGDLLGSPVKVRFRAKAAAESDGDSDEVDISQLEERPHLETDPTALLASELGAEVVDD